MHNALCIAKDKIISRIRIISLDQLPLHKRSRDQNSGLKRMLKSAA